MMQLLLYIVVGVLILYFGFARRSVRQRAIRAVAEQLGLEAFDRSLDGELDGYRITTEYVRRSRFRRRMPHTLILEIKLHTVPADLRLQRESTRKNVDGAIHAVDLEVGDHPFDSTFFVECDDEAATKAWLSNADRRRALVGLDRWVEAFSLRDRWLEIELASDPLEISDLRETVQWLRLIGQRIDMPEPVAVPPPILHRDKKLSGCALVLFLIPLAFLLLFCALLLLLLIEKAEDEPQPFEEPPELVYMEPEAAPERENLFAECIDALPMTPDIDTSACEKLLVGQPDLAPEVIEARQQLLDIELRKAHRVALDPEQVRAVVERFESIPRTSEGRKAAKRANDDRTRRTYDVGLLDDYMARESFAPDAALPRAAASLDVLLNNGTSYVKPQQVSDNDMLEAARCLVGMESRDPRGRDATEIFVACGEGHLQGRYMKEDGEALAGLERDPASTLRFVLTNNRNRRERSRDFQIATNVHELTSPNLIPNRQGYNLRGVASAMYPPTCNTPWLVDNASLDPILLERAIPNAGSLAPRLRLWAARQHLGLGNVDAARKQIAAIGPRDAEAVCAAQLATAVGDAEQALAMLARIRPSDDNHATKMRHLALAHAHARLGNWKSALEHGREALVRATHAPDRAAAAIVVAVAAAELGEPDELAEIFGPMPDPDLHSDRQAFDHPVLATRWFARAAMGGQDRETARWLAPAYMPLEPGSEWLQLYVASKLAPVDKMDYWLDSLLSPDGFEPYGLVEGRRMVAELRGDAEGLKRWNAIAKKQRQQIKDASDLRLMRKIRRLSPGSR